MAIRLKDEAALKATSATKLATARTINGTNFDGSANITTSNWGTTRTLTVGNTGKSVNGSGNVSWSLSEIGAAAATHNHGLLHSDFTATIENTTTDNGWSMINSSYNGFLLKSLRTNASAPSWIQNNYAAGIAFGGADTKGVLSVAYGSPSIRFAGGNNTKPTWYLTLTGTSAKTYNMDSLAANTANTLATARTINGTSFNGSANITTANWGTARTLTVGNAGKSVNGSGNISWSLAEIGALPLAGGTMTGTISSQAITPKTTVTYDLGGTSNIFKSAHSGTIHWYDTTNKKEIGKVATGTVGTTDTVGTSYLHIGNATASGTAGNAKGMLRIYGSNTGYTNFAPANTSTTNYTINIPALSGKMAIAEDNSSGQQEIITLGNGTSNSNTSGRAGILRLYGTNTGRIDLAAPNSSTAYRMIWLPDKGGTLALTNDVLLLTGGTVTGYTYFNGETYFGSKRYRFNMSGLGINNNNYSNDPVDDFHIGPSDWGELKVTGFALGMDYRPVRALRFLCDDGLGSALSPTTFLEKNNLVIENDDSGISGSLWCGAGGFVVQGRHGANLHLGANGASNNITIYGNPNDTNTGIHMGLSVTMKSGLDMNNTNITNVNGLTFADPGHNEGIEWSGGNGWKIYESPDGLTNAAGNLQFVTNSTRRATFSTSGNLNLAGNNVTFTTRDAVITANLGYLVLKSVESGVIYAQGGSLRVTAPGAPGTYKPALASAFTVSSLSKHKDDITPIEEDKSIDTMEILKSTNVYTYKLKDDLENGIDKKKIGLIVEQATADLSDHEEEGIELYQMASTLWDVCKKQQEAIEKLQQEINELKAS